MTYEELLKLIRRVNEARAEYLREHPKVTPDMLDTRIAIDSLAHNLKSEKS